VEIRFEKSTMGNQNKAQSKEYSSSNVAIAMLNITNCAEIYVCKKCVLLTTDKSSEPIEFSVIAATGVGYKGFIKTRLSYTAQLFALLKE
jgi:hypothetical protein